MGTTMALLYESVVSLITKEPSTREDRDVELLIPWFQNMSELFKSQTTDVVQDIVRNCEFRSVSEDTVIIRQGDRGECFYIILSGVVSIYINQTLEDEGNIATSSQDPLGRRQHTDASSTSNTRRHRDQHSRQQSEHDDNNNVIEPEVDETDINRQTIGELDGDAGSPDEVDRSTSAKSLHHPPHDDVDNDDGRYTASSEQSGSCTESSGEDEPPSLIGDHNRVSGTERKLLGNHIRQLDAGQSFGELALVQSNVRRNATVVADTQTDLIVVNRDLYNRSLKAAQQQEFKEKNDFVNNLPLFKQLTPRLKNVMAMSLSPVRFQYGNTMMKQGHPVQRMLFLLSGHAKISMDPIQHIQQYAWMCTDQEQQFAKDIRSGRESRLTWPGRPRQPDVRGVPRIVRRRGSYVDAERERSLKLLHVCVIGPNDYIGDLEVLLKLPTYAYTVQCMEPVEALELNLTNFERIISKRSHNTLLTMRQMSETKLRSRVSRLANEQVNCAVMHRILDILEDQNTPQSVKTARRKEEEEATSLVLQVPSWHNYRDKQRQYLRKRERERRQREHQVERMAHATRLTVQMRLQNSDDVETGLNSMEHHESPHKEQVDENVMMFVRRLSIDMARVLVPSNNSPRRRMPSINSESLLTNGRTDVRKGVNLTRRRTSSQSSSVE
ncbi:uncharacterized protein [Amphiura filiformis]|uniref:uncharacterized protein n=1 Tax=Amphiura filiformis TaxID=82378 RepID=UPI003B215D1F